jgi:hypothetical protein
MNPNPWFKIAFILIGCLFCAFLGWYPEHLVLVNYKEKVAADAKVAEKHNEDLLAQQKLITKQVTDSYEDKLFRIKSYYSSIGMHNNSASKLPSTSPTKQGIDGTATDPQFVEKCAITTQQLESLQDFVNQQLGLK